MNLGLPGFLLSWSCHDALQPRHALSCFCLTLTAGPRRLGDVILGLMPLFCKIWPEQLVCLDTDGILLPFSAQLPYLLLASAACWLCAVLTRVS